MAEQGQKNLERFAEFATQLKESGTFKEQEINKLVKTARKFESKLSGGEKHLKDFKAAIEFEIRLIGELKKRRNAMRHESRVEWFFIMEVVTLYTRGLTYFSKDYAFNLDYFQYLKYFPDLQQKANLHARDMLQRFCSEPDVFQKVASWYYHNNEFEEAKNTLLQGQSHHPKNLEILLDLFELEYKNPAKHSIVPRLKKYIDFIVDRKSPPRFLEEIILYLDKQDDLKNVAAYATEKLMAHYNDDVDMWQFVAVRELKGDCYPTNINEHPEVLVAIEKAVSKYREGVVKLPFDKKAALWNHYLSLVTNLFKYYNPNLRMEKFAVEAYEAAKMAHAKLNESHYMAWIEICKSDDNLLLSKIEEAIKDCGQSEMLWCMYLKTLMIIEEWDSIESIFKRAITALGPHSQLVWDIYINGCMLKYPTSYVKKQFENALKQPYDEVVSCFKPRYLTWIAANFGMKIAREAYQSLAYTVPYSKKLHQEMFNLERMNGHTTRDTKILDKILQVWRSQFGSSDCGVYAAWVELVKEKGGLNENEELGKIYNEAIARLSDHQAITQFKDQFKVWTDGNGRTNMQTDDSDDIIIL